MKIKKILIASVLLTGILLTACGEKQKTSDELADAPVTAPADFAPDVNQELETAVTPETAPPVD